jgi:hypothetical protein
VVRALPLWAVCSSLHWVHRLSSEPQLRAAPEDRRRRYKVDIAPTGSTQPHYVMTYVVATFEIEAETKWEEIKAHHRKPEEVWPM